jgi:hypothetical protein
MVPSTAVIIDLPQAVDTPPESYKHNRMVRFDWRRETSLPIARSSMELSTESP